MNGRTLDPKAREGHDAVWSPVGRRRRGARGPAWIALLVLFLGACTLEESDTMTSKAEASGAPGAETITLGGGCFWCTEAVFQELRGVEKVESGYSGGTVANPTYEQVCTGATGHAEVIQVTFDPNVITLREILEVFFTVHDPTTLNRQGADRGTQYRSAIFYRTPRQKAVSEDVIRDLEARKLWPRSFVTEVSPFEAFYAAEDYHREYYRRNGYYPYCRLVIAPKVEKFRKEFADKLNKP